MQPEQVLKRDGITVQGFEPNKIERAVNAAWIDVHGEPAKEKILSKIVSWVTAQLGDGVVDVEHIQDVVEIALMKHWYFDVAKAYVLYRAERAQLRSARSAADPQAISDYIHPAKYARFRPDLQRRELFSETVDRVEDMHLRRWTTPDVQALIRDAFGAVRRREVLPSMRSMQFGGAAIEANNARMYNCCYTFVDRPRAFAETMWLLLSGSGTGYSVQFHHVEQLPSVARIDPSKVHHHTVGDSIEGWAHALEVLVDSYMTPSSSVYGCYVEFNFSRVRGQGTLLKTSGGRAPGHLRLKRSLERIRAVLDNAAGRKLRPIECHDIQCHSADAILSGGIRRSAMIVLFSHDDGEMMFAKTGNWHDTHPWRANANNSVILLRQEAKRSQFARVFYATKEWGDPGFYFTHSLEYGCNPCGEIGLYPVWHAPDGRKLTGWAFCNLTEVNGAKVDSPSALFAAVRRAAVIGTLQAAYASFPFLGEVSENIARRDALLGVGITGMMDSPEICLSPTLQRQAAELAVRVNRDVAELIGINPAARVTTVKPSGTTSLALGGTGSGIHVHHARRYIRRVVANEDETIFRYFRSVNPHMCVKKPNGDWVIEFPVQAPSGAMVQDDLTAIQFLTIVLETYRHWIVPGTVRDRYLVDAGTYTVDLGVLTHNVSNTVVVGDDEWKDVEDFLWEHRDSFAGVTLFSRTNDKKFPFAPREAVVTAADEARWNVLVSRYTPVDYTAAREELDDVNLQTIPACEGDRCELPQ